MSVTPICHDEVARAAIDRLQRQQDDDGREISQVKKTLNDVAPTVRQIRKLVARAQVFLLALAALSVWKQVGATFDDVRHAWHVLIGR